MRGVKRVMVDVFINVTGRKQAEEGRELLVGEMSHRVENLLAIASGLAAITSRSTTTVAEWPASKPSGRQPRSRARCCAPVLGETEVDSALLGDLADAV